MAKAKASNLTFSAGLVEYPTDGKNAESLLETCDKRLYKAKESGRDKVVGEIKIGIF